MIEEMDRRLVSGCERLLRAIVGYGVVSARRAIDPNRLRSRAKL
jgi:hypothetical protein